MKVRDLAWAAGFFDGEGYVGLAKVGSRNNRLRAQVSVSQKRREPLEEFERFFGGRVYDYEFYQWHLRALPDIKNLLKKLIPFSRHPDKIRKMREVLRWIERKEDAR